MATIDYSRYSGSDSYSDGDIENIITDYIKTAPEFPGQHTVIDCVGRSFSKVSYLQSFLNSSATN